MNRYSELGDVEIVGDPAQQVTEADKQFVEFVNKGWKIADKIWVGLGGGTALLAGATAEFITQVSNPFKPYRIQFPSEYTVDTYLEELAWGSTSMVDGDRLSLSAFSEAANRGDVSLPTVQTSMRMTARIVNASANDINVAIQFNGFRLRG